MYRAIIINLRVLKYICPCYVEIHNIHIRNSLSSVYHFIIYSASCINMFK